jgi:asparagine synthase (glutamine-hydrolysing)
LVAELETVERMVGVLKHRGPDAVGIASSATGDAVLGMATLTIVTPGAGFGPFVDEKTGVTVTYNGEIYDFRNAAVRLGVALQPEDTDGNFVLRTYLKLGVDFVRQVDGMFAVAIHDPRSAVTFLIRDAIGQKPLYYRRSEGGLHFASEVKALLDDPDPAVDVPTSVLAVETPLGTTTPYVDVELLDAGTVLRYDHRTGAYRTWRHWAITDATAPPDADWVGLYATALSKSTQEQAYEGEHALLLSGGVDSGVLAYLIRPTVCYTVRYRGYPQLDESRRAEAISRETKSELVVIEPSPEDFQRVAPDIVAALDYPVGNASLLSEYLCYEAISQSSLRVIYGGIGPDEHLLGYVRHMLALFGPEAVMKAGLTAYAPLVDRLGPQHTCAEQVDSRYLRLVLRGPDDGDEARRVVAEQFRRAGLRADQALTLVDQSLSMPALLLTSDKLSSAFGLERRSPYLSKELMEISYAAPLEWRARTPVESKLLLRSAGVRLGVPEWIVTTEHSKQGFASPVPRWLTRDLRQWCDDRLEVAAAAHPPRVLAELFASARNASPHASYERTRMMGLLWALWWSSRVQGSLDEEIAPLIRRVPREAL